MSLGGNRGLQNLNRRLVKVVVFVSTVLFRLSSRGSEVSSFELTLNPATPPFVEMVLSGPTNTHFLVELSQDLNVWKPFLGGSFILTESKKIRLPDPKRSPVFFRCNWKQVPVPQIKLMVQIPGGTFMMGHEGIAWPVHQVTLSGFEMDVSEVTGAEWNVIKEWAMNPDRGDQAYDLSLNPGSYGDNHPVVFINWFEALKWANARSERESLEPVYYTDSTFTTVVRSGVIEISNNAVKWDASGYRLPTEAEWEYAAVAGRSGSLYPWGSSLPDSSMLNNEFQFDTKTVPVGSYAPNDFGLFDMAGNVREWCWDLHKYDDAVSYTNHIVFSPYDPEAQFNPRGPLIGPRGMSRGGGWVDHRDFVQSVRRHNDERDRESDFLGFRLVR